MASLAGHFDSMHSFYMQDYRIILNDEFRKKNEKNKRFTLRAYAQLLELNSGSLSAILSGRRHLNLPMDRSEKIFKEKLLSTISLK